MTVFTGFINFLESFLFSYFVGSYFNVNHKKVYVMIVTLFQFFLLTYAGHIGNSGLWLTISVVIMMVMSLIINQKKMLFDYIYISVIYNILIIICAFLAVFLSSPILNYFNCSDFTQYMILCLVAKSLQIVSTCFLLKKMTFVFLQLDIKEWSSILVTDILFLTILTILTISLVNDNHSVTTINIIFLLVFLAALTYRDTINKISQMNREKIEYTKLSDLLKYNQEKVHMMNHLKNDISAADHRMAYILYQMEVLLKEKKYVQLEKSLHQYRDLMSKYKMVVDTNNPVFDCLYSLKINDLIVRGINIENTIIISSKDEYNDIRFINHLTDLIELFTDCKILYIFMDEYGELLSVKIIYRDGAINEKLIQEHCDMNFAVNASYNMKNHEINGLRVSIHMGKKYGRVHD